jgi:ABC-2 type transport system permease protein
MTAQSALTAVLGRQPPPLGGFSPAIVRLEVRRLLRNRRTMILALALPVLFFWGFGLNNSYVHETAGHGNVSAAEMISIALYGAVAATAACGAMVSIEQAAGWSRQLRVTPLSPAAYVVIKMLTSLVLAAGAVAAVTNKASMPADLWVITGLCVWVGSLLFAAFGLFARYLLPSENVTQLIALGLTQLRRRPVHPGQPVLAGSADLRHVHAAVRAQPARPLPADRRHPAMGLDLEPGRVARDLRDRRRLGAFAATPPECDQPRSHALVPRTRRMTGSAGINS